MRQNLVFLQIESDQENFTLQISFTCGILAVGKVPTLLYNIC